MTTCEIERRARECFLRDPEFDRDRQQYKSFDLMPDNLKQWWRDRAIRYGSTIATDRELTLSDALQGCLDWIEENCPDPVYPYCVTEGRAALKGIGIVRTDGVSPNAKED